MSTLMYIAPPIEPQYNDSFGLMYEHLKNIVVKVTLNQSYYVIEL